MLLNILISIVIILSYFIGISVSHPRAYGHIKEMCFLDIILAYTNLIHEIVNYHVKEEDADEAVRKVEVLISDRYHKTRRLERHSHLVSFISGICLMISGLMFVPFYESLGLSEIERLTIIFIYELGCIIYLSYRSYHARNTLNRIYDRINKVMEIWNSDNASLNELEKVLDDLQAQWRDYASHYEKKVVKYYWYLVLIPIILPFIFLL